MSISARNRFSGTISAVTSGPVNAQVELTLPGGDRIVAIVTNDSVRNLALAVGKEATAFVKAPWILVLAGDGDGIRFSARNRLTGVVESVTKGAVNAEVAVRLPGGALAYAVITNEALLDLSLKPDVPATLLFKASHVILGVPE
jgi:molybdate transport system regulatory protein